MTKIYYDTEFIEDGKTIDLISIGMIAEDGREYYAVSDSFNWRKFRKNPWLMENVLPGLPRLPSELRSIYPKMLIDKSSPVVKSRDRIANEVRRFISNTSKPELWAWYGAYDHVALCQLFGPMIKLPVGIPMFTNDLKQECERLGNPDMPKQEVGNHNALYDARHNKRMADFLTQYDYMKIREKLYEPRQRVEND